METGIETICSLQDFKLIRETKEYRHTPFGFREYLCRDKRLTQSSKLAWMVLSDYSVFSSEFKIHMSLRTLGEKIGKDKRTAKRTLEELEKYGYILTNLKDAERGNDTTIIWVRFPEEAAQAILQKPDRKTPLKKPKLEIINGHCQESSLENDKGKIVCESGISAELVAFVPKSGAIVPPINTNITDLTITKETTNNVSSNQVSGNTQRLDVLNRLIDVECLFFKFVERANLLKKQALDEFELKKALWEPYNNWEIQVIKKYDELRSKYMLPRNIGNIAEVLPAYLKYDEEHTNATSLGMSGYQACHHAKKKLTTKEEVQWSAITVVISQFGDDLKMPQKSVTKPPVDKTLEQKTTVVINLNTKREPVTISQNQADWLVLKLKTAYEKGRVTGEASKYGLSELAEQLFYHVENWNPRTIQYQKSEERIHIALNVALKRMKEGNWSAPYGWVAKRIQEREKEAIKLKNEERTCVA